MKSGWQRKGPTDILKGISPTHWGEILLAGTGLDTPIYPAELLAACRSGPDLNRPRLSLANLSSSPE